MFYNLSEVGSSDLASVVENAQVDLIFQESHYRASLIPQEFRVNHGQGVRLSPALPVTLQYRLSPCRVHVLET